MAFDTGFAARDGLATLGHDAVALRQAVDDMFAAWAARCGARSALYPPLLRVADLARFDYFVNFPHLGLCAAAVSDAAAPELARQYLQSPGAQIAASDLEAAGYMLPSAACYGVYLSLSGEDLQAPVTITTIAQCFRREQSYDGLRRLRGFTMREIVTVGHQAQAKDHIAAFRDVVLDCAERLGMPLGVQAATDPFFDPRGSRASSQLLFPVKEEFVSADGVAIASVNYHRNFFGERSGITAEGKPAHSSCVAFGVERWLDALSSHFSGDLVAARHAILQLTAAPQGYRER